jgi:hypothetical protein
VWVSLQAHHSQDRRQHSLLHSDCVSDQNVCHVPHVSSSTQPPLLLPPLKCQAVSDHAPPTCDIAHEAPDLLEQPVHPPSNPTPNNPPLCCRPHL